MLEGLQADYAEAFERYEACIEEAGAVVYDVQLDPESLANTWGVRDGSASRSDLDRCFNQELRDAQGALVRFTLLDEG